MCMKTYQRIHYIAHLFTIDSTASDGLHTQCITVPSSGKEEVVLEEEGALRGVVVLPSSTVTFCGSLLRSIAGKQMRLV